MKIVNFSTLSFLFSTIMQIFAGYACPGVSTINTKITQKGSMRFSLTERDPETREEVFFRYKGRKNKIEKFYVGNSKVDRFRGAFYFPDTPEIPGSLTCTYKQVNNKFFLLAMTKRKVRGVEEEMIVNDVNSNWRAPNTGFYACGEEGIVKEDACRFSFKPS
ncbi:MAG: hypothetical protein E6K54_02885 [Gammaproteobacteria bacterium]|nr:MAG: hypothetical protein E6K54_02885 [Gammaproteobacteria bacterium]